MRLNISNMHCTSCVNKIQNSLLKLESVSSAAVNFANKTVEIKGTISEQVAIDELKKLGFEASNTYEHHHHESNYGFISYLIKAIVAGVLGLAILLAMWFNLLPTLSHKFIWLGIAAITAAGMFFSGRDIYLGAFKAFLQHYASMDTLVALGTFAAWVFSLVIVLFPQYFPEESRFAYFEASLIILAFINFGSALELRAQGKTSEAIEKLMSLNAKTVHVLVSEVEKEIAIDDLQENDIIKVYPGETVPVDGVVIKGHTTIDESMITGEPLAVAKKVDNSVTGGTLNKSSAFVFKATRVGKNTTLSKIISLVQSAQNSKPAIAKLTDKISSVFVPGVLIFSICVALLWLNLGFPISYAFICMMSVLVIACPCALGLAVPISVIVGIGKAAQYGILIREGGAVQTISKINTMVFDKTGTLTTGHTEITDIVTLSDITQTELLQYAASVETFSEHPIAQAIVDRAKHDNINLLEVNNVETLPGLGIKASVQSETILIGNLKLLESLNISVEKVKNLSSAQTTIYIATDKQLSGYISIADPIKPESKEVILNLKELGIKTIMLTGDNLQIATSVADKLGIDEVIADVLPEQKYKTILDLQKGGQVAMVGDGINDAAALAQADVGFAMGSGTDVAMESADVTIMRSSLESLIQAILISRATMRNIKQNLFGAFIYNIAGLLIAAGALYPLWGILLNPIFAGAAMAASSLTVVTNANRLRLLKLREKS